MLFRSGDWDYQRPPTGAAILVEANPASAPDWLSMLGDAMRAAGLPLYAVGYSTTPTLPVGTGWVVLRHDCSSDEREMTEEWLHSHSGVEIALVSRVGDESYE